MQIAREIAEVRQRVADARADGARIGFVPTMGALHAGHVSLLEAARRDGLWLVVSIFVNPTQFGPNEDFAAYPRDEAGDLARCRDAGASLVFLPRAETLFPPTSRTKIHVSELTDGLCGPFRPGHFEGVATVVAKLFNIVQPDCAYFGEKDAQQLAVIRRMVADLDFPVRVVGCPTVRELDGLAMSSRNAYLDPAQRAQARSLSAALERARALVATGERDPAIVVAQMRSLIISAGPATIDYISVVDPLTLSPLERIGPAPALIALAVRIGGTRLIDNRVVDPRVSAG